MKSSELKRAKRRTRRAILDDRDALPADVREERGERVVERFLELPEVQRATTVMLFSHFGSEVPTGSLIRRLHEHGVVIALPRIEHGHLVPVAFAPGDPTTTASFGAQEPVDGTPLDPASIDVVAVPGVAFDRDGRRVGYGGGYYDRFLRNLPAFTVAVAFGLQVVEEALPAGRFDLPVQAIVTEDETIRAANLNSRSTS
jgi:5-formyltetrahydrofolate cyclo-ligase